MLMPVLFGCLLLALVPIVMACGGVLLWLGLIAGVLSLPFVASASKRGHERRLRRSVATLGEEIALVERQLAARSANDES